MGPYGEPSDYPWDMGGISGLRRFLERVYGLNDHISGKDYTETTRLLHKTIKKVTDDIGLYKFNTAISALMIFINHAEKSGITKESYKTFLRLLAPFAPHIAEELWANTGESGSIHSAQWPEAEHVYLLESEVTLGVQINGKMRGTIIVPKDAEEAFVVEQVKNDTALGAKIGGEIRRIIYVKNKIINLII
jgi:leucyl-tRNA synthetase